MSALNRLFTSSALGAGGLALASFGAGPVTFGAAAAPAILAATGAALPPLWRLLSSIKTKPIKESFPGIRLLFNLEAQELKPYTMPPWQKVLCLSTVVAAGLSAALPEINDNLIDRSGQEPVVILIDNGWASAPVWDARKQKVEDILSAAAADSRKIAIIPMADPVDFESGGHYKLMDASEALGLVSSIEAQSWPVNYSTIIEPLSALKSEISATASVFWMSDGLEPNDPAFIKTLEGFGHLTVFENDVTNKPHMLSLEESRGDEMAVRVDRLDSKDPLTLNLMAFNQIGQPLMQNDAVFAAGETSVTVAFNIPPDIRATLARITVDGKNSAGTTLLLDENWRQRSVGVVVSSGQEETLLSGSNFIAHAIASYTDLHTGSISELLNQSLSVLTLTDDYVLKDNEAEQVRKWVEAGGTLIRFAGNNMASKPDDSLLPVTIRKGVRSIAGALGSDEGNRLVSFSDQSPLAGLEIPGTLEIKNVVLPEPSSDVEANTWASFDDGTPFITARSQGEGSIILIHTTANLEWSNLPLSGDFFLNMMKQLVSYSQGAGNDAQLKRDLMPILTLDSFGLLEQPNEDVKPLTRQAYESASMTAINPPGYYGNSVSRIAYNVSDVVDGLRPLEGLPENTRREFYQSQDKGFDYGSMLLILAFAAMMADMAVRQKNNSVKPSASARISKKSSDSPGLDRA